MRILHQHSIRKWHDLVGRLVTPTPASTEMILPAAPALHILLCCHSSCTRRTLWHVAGVVVAGMVVHSSNLG